MSRRLNPFRILAMLGMLAILCSIRQPALADDTDLFTINPTVSDQRPNVLIILDSSANWDQTDTRNADGGPISKYVLSAMADVIDGLTDQFNVGLMMFAETGSPNDNIDGGVMRMGMRWMNSTNRTALSTFFRSIDSGYDKSNNTSMGMALAEAYYYYSGKTAYSGLGKAKRDYLGNNWSNVGASQQNAPAAMQTASNTIWNLPLPADTPLPRNALTDSSSTVYNKPITDACQKNFIIYISNGPFSDPNASNSAATTRLAAEGGNTDTILFTQNTGLQGNISDEWTRFLANPDPNNASKPIIVTYTLGVDLTTLDANGDATDNPISTGQFPNTVQLLKSVGSKNTGNGGSYWASSGGGGAAIALALNKIFAEIAAVNSVFASSTLPVSVNIRGAFLNQVYMGVFRPDANASPRWPGNVKQYSLAADATGNVFLVDKLSQSIENTTTGFVSPNVVSYWTTASTFWDNSYYPDTVVQAPLTPTTSDSPDGEFVEKGGAAEHLRSTYASTINDASSPRKLYTCIGCAADTDLSAGSPYDSSATAFATGNSSITDALLGVTATKSVTSLARSGNTVTAVSATHGFSSGQTVNIAGADQAQYDGDHTITVVDGNTFTYTITELPVSPATAASGQTLTAAKGSGSLVSITSLVLGGTNGNTVTATTSAAHNFTTGQSVTISGANEGEYDGTFAVTVTDATHFTYTIVTSPATPASTPGNVSVTRSDGTTASSAVSSIARSATTVTVSTSGNVFTGTLTCSAVTVTSAVSATYNVSGRTCTKVGNKQLTFQLSASEVAPVSPATGTILADASVTRTISSMTRPTGSGTVTVVTSAAHTFTSGDSITISGASDSLYNGVHTIAVVNATTFTFGITPQPVSPATGTITATGSGGVTRDDLINWVRGENIKLDDNPTPTATLVRGYLHGDVLHSRPAVINYNRYGQPAERDLVVFYGANDGIVHAVKGGQNDADGYEKWGFVPQEFFTKFARLYNESPIISTSDPRSYFADGPISVNAEYVTDTTHDPSNPIDRIEGTGALAQIYVGMRRGGRFYYSLDVTNPDTPIYKWKIDNATAGFEELGQTWSEAHVSKLRLANCPGTGTSGACKVLIFGGGYDAAANDPDTQGTATMGRAIYVVDALTGQLIWHTGPAASGTGSGSYVQSAGMRYAIPADLSVINSDLDVNGYDDRIYAADTGANIWRVNISDSNPANWTVYKVASLRSDNTAANARKFLFAPDIVAFDSTTDSVLIGSGDREHPFDTTVGNRFYMIKDAHEINAPAPASVITESDLCDLTANNLQGTDQALITADKTCLDTSSGWMIRLLGKDPKDPTNVSKQSPGEKTVTGATTLGGTVIFATNTPTQTTLANGQCTGSLGTALVYAVSFKDATATVDFDGSGSATQSEQFTERVGGGFPPTAIPFSVQIGSKFYEGAITGTKVVQPPSAPLGQRYRVFWNLSIDQ
jgi:type IV pilus assembly protein PilY1